MPDERQTSEIAQVARWLAEARTAVAFTGAGISTESGIPDFRSPGGVWSRYRTVYFQEFVANAEARYEYWRQKAEAHRDFADALPNLGHAVLARWQAAGRIGPIVTQNIDGLHQAAGCREVLELHGTARHVACLDCGRREPADPAVARFLATARPPACEACGGWLKHATVSFGQSLPEEVLAASIGLARRADLFLAIGSSLVVEPAASLPRIAREHGARLVIVNRDETPLDPRAHLVLRAGIGQTLEAIARELSVLRVEA
jgi:NAD-dependent deacetylase